MHYLFVIDNYYVVYMYIVTWIPAGRTHDNTHFIIVKDGSMASLTRNTQTALSQVVASIGAAGNVVSKAMLALDRLTDAGYSHADTFAGNTELRNQGSIQDTILDEEERALEREIRRLKFEQQREDFLNAHAQRGNTAKTTKAKK
jgi:hypothetical protein